MTLLFIHSHIIDRHPHYYHQHHSSFRHSVYKASYITFPSTFLVFPHVHHSVPRVPPTEDLHVLPLRCSTYTDNLTLQSDTPPMGSCLVPCVHFAVLVRKSLYYIITPLYFISHYVCSPAGLSLCAHHSVYSMHLSVLFSLFVYIYIYLFNKIFVYFV